MSSQVTASEFAPVADAEYALIRERLPESQRPVFDRLRDAGERLSEVVDEYTSRGRYVAAWIRAVQQARNDGLGRYVRIHDLRLTKAHQIYRRTNAY